MLRHAQRCDRVPLNTREIMSKCQKIQKLQTSNFKNLLPSPSVLNLSNPYPLPPTPPRLVWAFPVHFQLNVASFSKGVRDKAKKMVFLVTDGHSNVDKHLTIPKADELTKSGVQIFVVAVGSYIDGIHELVKVASTPPEQFLFRAESLDGFLHIVQLVIEEITPRETPVGKGQYQCSFQKRDLKSLMDSSAIIEECDFLRTGTDFLV